jgi:hypothetical protein
LYILYCLTRSNSNLFRCLLRYIFIFKIDDPVIPLEFFIEKKKMEFPDDVLALIKAFSQPIPNNIITTGLDDGQIAEFFVDSWIEDKFAEDANLLFIISFSKKGCYISIYDFKFVYYEYTWSVTDLRSWDGYVGNRSARPIRCI